MTGASHAVPHGRCHHKGRGMGHRMAAFPELLAMMGPGRGPEGRGGPWGRGDFGFGGPGGPFGPGGPRGRGRRARRGDIRAAILLLLAEEPRNGYGLMQEIEERSGGVWRPSPGSVYPALSQLEDEDLVRATEAEGRKTFALTDAGTAHVEENRERFGTPWEAVGEGATSELHELRHALGALAAAAMQVGQTGTKAQLGEAKAILEEARRSLYRVLAGDTPGQDADSDADADAE